MKGLLLGIVIAMFVPIFFFLGIGLVVAPFVGGNSSTGGYETNTGTQTASGASPNAPNSGGALSANAVAALAKAAGVPADQLATAVAIAMAESALNPNATNVNTDGSVDRGLWQINNAAHPDVSDSSAFNPVTAAQGMLSISNGGTNWEPWVTYQTGAYQQYLPEAQQAVRQIGG